MNPSTDSQESVECFERSRHALKPSTDSQEGVGHCKGHCPGHTCCQNWQWREKHGQLWKSVGDGRKSVRHCLEPSTDSKEGVGRFSMSRHALKPSSDSQKGIGHCKGHCPGHTCCQNWRWREKHGSRWKSTGDGGKSVKHCLEPSTDSKEGVGCFSRSRHS